MQTPKAVWHTRSCRHAGASAGGAEDTFIERPSASELQQIQPPHYAAEVTGSVAGDAVCYWPDRRRHEQATGKLTSSVVDISCKDHWAKFRD